MNLLIVLLSSAAISVQIPRPKKIRYVTAVVAFTRSLHGGRRFILIFGFFVFPICSSAAVKGVLLLHDVASLLLCVNHIHAIQFVRCIRFLPRSFFIFECQYFPSFLPVLFFKKAFYTQKLHVSAFIRQVTVVPVYYVRICNEGGGGGHQVQKGGRAHTGGKAWSLRQKDRPIGRLTPGRSVAPPRSLSFGRYDPTP